jgi:hypothetical protein
MAFSYSPGSRPLTGSEQFAEAVARIARPGFSTDPGDYRPRRVRFSGEAYDPMAPSFRPEIDPAGFLIEGDATTAAGMPCVILGTLSGVEEVDRVTVDGKPTRQRFMIWSKQPQGTTPVKGKGGGIQTDRGGWINGRFDEVFCLIGNKVSCVTLWDAHHIVTEINQLAAPLPIGAMHEARWQLTKVERPDGEDQAGNKYFRREPHFELLGIVGQPNGPSEAEIANAKRLAPLIKQLSYPHPDVPLRLVVNGDASYSGPPLDGPPEPPPLQSPDEYGSGDSVVGRDDDLPDFLKK